MKLDEVVAWWVTACGDSPINSWTNSNHFIRPFPAGIRRKSALTINNNGKKRWNNESCTDFKRFHWRMPNYALNTSMWIWSEVWQRFVVCIWSRQKLNQSSLPLSLSHRINRFDISESETKAKFIDRIAFGTAAICIFAGLREMVGGTNIAEGVYIFPRTLCAATVQLDRLQLQCARHPWQQYKCVVDMYECIDAVCWWCITGTFCFVEWIAGAVGPQFGIESDSFANCRNGSG